MAEFMFQNVGYRATVYRTGVQTSSNLGFQAYVAGNQIGLRKADLDLCRCLNLKVASSVSSGTFLSWVVPGKSRPVPGPKFTGPRDPDDPGRF